jgi:hypothetical protein
VPYDLLRRWHSPKTKAFLHALLLFHDIFLTVGRDLARALRRRSRGRQASV